MTSDDDREFGKGSDKVEENVASPRVLGDSSGSSDEENRINSGVCNDDRVSPIDLDLGVPGIEGDVKVSGNGRSEEDRAIDYAEDNGSPDEDMGESGGFEVKNENLSDDQIVGPDDDQLNGQNNKIDVKFEVEEDTVSRVDKNEEVEKFTDPEFKSLLSEFDDYVANDRIGGGTSRALSYGFEVGDMVWGKVKSHPWWPGHIFNEAFASSPVRRTRREGHVLVAFFGDSSYGWFDPAELIPFEPNFAEKSQQTTSRNFIKAVEEAVDEASRRCGLGLTCKCRNAYNFRPTNVQGYFVVDVPDYEAGGVYSANQIRKARNSFKSREALSFVKQLALVPQDSDLKSLEFIQSRATVFAFRRAVFEEFDETYAQAFGVQSARTSNDIGVIPNQPVKQPPRAPLSGPLVIAETLGGAKSAKRPIKVKDHSKKDRFLFKRRDESSDSKTVQISQGQVSSSMPSAYMEGSSVFLAGDYVLQKRGPVSQMSLTHEQDFISQDGASSSGDVSGKVVTLDQATPQGAATDIKPSFNQEEKKGGAVDGSSPVIQQEGNAKIDLKHEAGTLSGSLEGLQKPDLNSTPKVEGGQGLDQAQEGSTGGPPSPTDAKQAGGTNVDGRVKKVKVLKRPLGDLGLESSVMVEKKKKKKKVVGLEMNADNLQKHLTPGKVRPTVGNFPGKFDQIGLAPRDESQLNKQKKDVGPGNSLPNSAGTSAMAATVSSGLELSQLLDDLHALALDPFHGIERNCPGMIRKFFLRFRSLVYQKSLVLSSSSEMEQPPSTVGASENSSDGNLRTLTTSKQVKALGRPDDPARIGRKRLPSDRQEEIAAKKLKKMNQLKSLAAEKKAAQKIGEGPRVEVKEQLAVLPSAKAIRKPDFVKKMQPPARAAEPTMLVMKFPPGVSLPSVAELKAKFGRFGSLDQAAIRVFWKSSTCRVVFRHKTDAQAAFRYANGNNSLFGNVSVKFLIRTVEAPGSEAPESDKTRGDDAVNDSLRVLDRPTHQALPQQTVQLKSCLKKPTSEEAGQVTTGGRGTPRVKFMLGGEETNTSRGEQMMVGNRNNFNNSSNASFADAGAHSSSVAMEFNSKNFQKVIPSPSPSLLPLPPLAPPFTKSPHNNMLQTEAIPRNAHNLNTPQSIDISQQMLSLLTRCNDVVTNLTGMLGYVPYHPL
ncbi:hypothetical protein SLA2020_038270 [Shorea laevis]